MKIEGLSAGMASEAVKGNRTISIFSNPEDATLVSRPNRFIMMVKDSGGNILRAHCPNPGKLTEFLVPGQPLLVEHHTSPERRTDCTVVAVRYKDKIIPLYASKANSIAKQLVLPLLYPGREIIPEWKAWYSRFDFLVRGTPDLLTEVKACSLSEHGLAMFPDAATERGSRHVEELIELSAAGYEGEVLFIISHEDAELFIPNPHTDPLFCRVLHRARRHLSLRAVSASTDSRGNVRIVNDRIPIDTEISDRLARENRGVYLLAVELKHPLKIPVPRIGSPVLAPGWYLYAGSAGANLHQRIARHLRKKKKIHWHIDHLTLAGSTLKAFPVLTGEDLECRLASDVAHIAEYEIPGFGCSDCSCTSHLFFFSENPLHSRDLLDLLFFYRHKGFAP
jgi:sugar fermentation stimulation protein A